MAVFPIPIIDPLLAVERSLIQVHNMIEDVAKLTVKQAQPPVGYYRPWQHVPGQKSGISRVHFDKDRFRIDLDVQRFSPEEITVKTVDNHIVIEGKHEEKEDEHGFVARHFVRRYSIPKGVDIEAIQSQLSSDGELTITTPTLQPIEGTKERVIPITATGEPANKEVSKK